MNMVIALLYFYIVIHILHSIYCVLMYVKLKERRLKYYPLLFDALLGPFLCKVRYIFSKKRRLTDPYDDVE
jgi:hypothetical protein